MAEKRADNSEYRFSEEQQQLRTAVRKFCADNFDEPTVRRLMESDVTFDAKVWNRLGSELGVLGLSVPRLDLSSRETTASVPARIFKPPRCAKSTA